jgi:hypothetical protein
MAKKDKNEWSEEYNRPMLASQLLAVKVMLRYRLRKFSRQNKRGGHPGY